MRYSPGTGQESEDARVITRKRLLDVVGICGLSAAVKKYSPGWARIAYGGTEEEEESSSQIADHQNREK